MTVRSIIEIVGKFILSLLEGANVDRAMRTRTVRGIRRLGMILLVGLLHGRALGTNVEPLVIRQPFHKPSRTTLGPFDRGDRIAVKLAEDSRDLQTPPATAPDPRDIVLSLLAAWGVDPSHVDPMFDRDPMDLARERSLGEQRIGRQLADLTHYFVVELPADVDPAALCDALNAERSIELALPFVGEPSVPIDLPPPTPDFSRDQRHDSPPPIGIGSLREIRGGDGAGITVVDVEFGWTFDHEDLELDGRKTNIDPEPLPAHIDARNVSHGTSVLGILGARDNGYGVTGLVPAATLRVAPVRTAKFGDNTARAISLATGAVREGDVILIEQQMPGVCGLGRKEAQARGPVEWFPPIFDAIRQATALGIVVVEPAGNDGVNLDDARCKGRFLRSSPDSGAIVVGAGSPEKRTRLPFSSFGERVDLQGWGDGIVTTGPDVPQEDVADPSAIADPRQQYTKDFGGTSGASAMVAGAVTALQGARKADGGKPLMPDEMRSLLVMTGSSSKSRRQIGPLPNLPGALAMMRAFASAECPVLPPGSRLVRRLPTSGLPWHATGCRGTLPRSRAGS